MKNISEPLPEIVLADGFNRRFTFSNKQAGFFLGNSHKENSGGFEGWTVNEFHFLRDYEVLVNGEKLNRAHCTFHYYPYGFKRLFPKDIVEECTLLDSVNILLVEISCPIKKSTVQIRPKVMRKHESSVVDKKTREITFSFPGMPEVELLKLTAAMAGKQDNKSYFYFTVHNTANHNPISIKELLHLKEKRIQRYKAMYALQHPKTDNVTLQQSLQWARCSLDALVTNQRGAGIWAGLPWFNNYWGRDTFISFPGALLVTGEFKSARKILKNFADFQLTDKNDPRFGRIPNRITNKEVIYNTADGTWWFIREVYEYLLYSRDTLFAKEMWPVVKRALDGALKYRTDDLGFLTHEDADTWMDAKGADGAWSPRGNRAVEIQALWYTALQIGAKLAEQDAEYLSQAMNWRKIAKRLKINFEKFFWNKKNKCLYDHINADGTQDAQLRPNQIFAVTIPDLPGILPLLSLQKQKQVARRVTQDLTLEHGVLSLSAADSNFHPWHHYPPYYVPDAAYHNGLIWTWLAGPVISAQLKFGQTNVAGKLYGNEARQILDKDAIGNFSELLEPVLRKGEHEYRISGTVSQAWSLAEFQRNFYQDIIGYQPDALNNKIYLQPVPLKNMQRLSARLPYKSGFVYFSLEKKSTSIAINLQLHSLPDTIQGQIHLSNQYPNVPFRLIGNKPWNYVQQLPPSRAIVKEGLDEDWHLAKIDSGKKFSVIADPEYQILKAENIYFPPGHNPSPIIFKKDALYDDRGADGHYTYPQNPAFAKGIFDILSLAVYDLGEHWGLSVTMRNLTDPGWHAEYGFQLSFLALAVNDSLIPENAERDIGRSSYYLLPASQGFKRIIYIGGGFEICDAQKKRLAAYIPYQKGFPIGFVNEKQIRFKIPKKYLPGLSSNSRITLLAGGQDDHGGAGIGEFRAIRKKTGEWHGGGAGRDEGASRIYDVLEIN